MVFINSNCIRYHHKCQIKLLLLDCNNPHWSFTAPNFIICWTIDLIYVTKGEILLLIIYFFGIFIFPLSISKPIKLSLIELLFYFPLSSLTCCWSIMVYYCARFSRTYASFYFTKRFCDPIFWRLTMLGYFCIIILFCIATIFLLIYNHNASVVMYWNCSFLNLWICVVILTSTSNIIMAKFLRSWWWLLYPTCRQANPVVWNGYTDITYFLIQHKD